MVETNSFIFTTLRRKSIFQLYPIDVVSRVNADNDLFFNYRTELRNEVTHRSHDVYAIALQPGNSIGSVFAAACQTHEKGGTVKIFDTRRSLLGKSYLIMSYKVSFIFLILILLDPVIEMESRDDMLTSVMFSPVEPTLIASSWKSNGTQLHDIRYKNM